MKLFSFVVGMFLLMKWLIIIGQGKQSISLEPGGQFELSGAPLETLHQTCAEVNSHLYQVLVILLLSSLSSTLIT